MPDLTDRTRGWLLVAGQFALLAALLLAPTGQDWQVPPAVEAVGTAGRVLGALTIILGGLQLGRAASIHPAPTHHAVLRRTGAYRHLRHPIYTGVLVLAAGIAATAGAIIHLVLYGGLVALLAVKAQFEERLLTETFPLYPAYARTTGRFLPRLRTDPRSRQRRPLRRPAPRSVVSLTGSRSIDIDASPDTVWDLIADVTATHRYSPLTAESTWVPPATGPTVGARFTSTNRLPVIRRWTSTSTIIACEPGQRFSFAIGRNPLDPNSTWSYDLQPAPSGTCVTESWAMVRESWMVRTYFRLIHQQHRLERGVEITLDRLKTRAESDQRNLGPQPTAEETR